MKTKINATRVFGPMAICLALIVLPLIPISNAGADTGSSISGSVTDAANPLGLAGVCVIVTQSGAQVGTATTGLLGVYEVDGLSEGTYDVEFDPSCGGSVTTPDVAQYYSNDYSVSTETPVAVGADVDMPGIDAALDAAATISGTVTDATHPSAAAGVCVDVSDASDSIGGSGNTTTAVDGSYSVTGLAPGSFQVFFDPTCSGSETSPALAQWYLGSATEGGATSVTVTPGNTTSAINASLQEKGAISGTVTDAFHPSGLVGICVSAASSDGGSGSGTATTSANGTYTISGLLPDTYTVNFDPTCSGSVSSHDVAKTFGSAVTVNSGATTANITALLATITGTSTNTAVTSSANPGNEGDSIIYTATVSPTDDGGTVAFTDNGQPISTCTAQPVASNVAHCTQTYAGVGSHEIGASYTGDEDFGSSIATNYDEVIQLITGPPSGGVKTSIELTSSVNPLLTGGVTYAVVVVPTVYEGTINFFDASVAIPQCQDVSLTLGYATCYQNPSAGSHSITASFSGTPGFLPSTSSTLIESVTPSTTTSIASNYNPAGGHDTIKLSTTTSPSPDGGTMQYEMDGAIISGCANRTLTDGKSTCQVKLPGHGNYDITAVYSGDTLFLESTSPTLSQVVLPNSGVSVRSSRGVAKRGQVVHFTSTVAAKFGTGFLTFTNNGRIIPGCGKIQLRFGAGVCSVRNFSVGRHVVSVAFSGNSRFAPAYNGLLEIIKKK
jgi:hypothetical protein